MTCPRRMVGVVVSDGETGTKPLQAKTDKRSVDPASSRLMLTKSAGLDPDQ
jgi:hypothetical protein